MTSGDEPPLAPEIWRDESGKEWRRRTSGVGKGTRKQFMRSNVRVMLWSYRAQPSDVLSDDREPLWKRVLGDDDEAAELGPPPCGLLTLDTYTDGEGGNVLLVREPRW